MPLHRVCKLELHASQGERKLHAKYVHQRQSGRNINQFFDHGSAHLLFFILFSSLVRNLRFFSQGNVHIDIGTMPLHYWLRGKWIKKVQKISKSTPLFLINSPGDICYTFRGGYNPYFAQKKNY